LTLDVIESPPGSHSASSIQVVKGCEIPAQGEAMPKKPARFSDYFDDGDEGECPPLTPKMVRDAERKLGYRLPTELVDLLKICNGGYLRRRYFPTTKCPRWAEDHVLFDQVMGIGGEDGIDGECGSNYLIAEWDYPDVGVVISSDGHTAFMLDYSKCGKDGDPRVIWVDVEGSRNGPTSVELAPNFASFLDRLRVPNDE